MDTAATGIVNPVGNTYWSTYDKISDLTRIYMVCFEKLSLVRDPDSKISYPATKKLISMSTNLKNILKNFRKAIIYSEYNLKPGDISDITQSIKSLDKYIKTLSATPANGSIRHCTSLKIIKDTMDSMTFIYTNIRSLASQYIDTRSDVFSFAPDAWPDNCVMIGSMRNSRQLDVSLKNHFYHIPAKLIDNADNIKCIALYQSKNIFENDACIRYYGKVDSWNKLPRSAIKELPSDLDEMYYRFEIREWKKLIKPIFADAMGEVVSFTNLYLFLNAEKTSELHLTTKDEYDVYNFMKNCAYTPFASEKTIKNSRINYTGGIFEISVKNKLHFKITNDDFSKRGVILAKRILSL